MSLAARTQAVLPFRAVELFKQAAALQAQGRDIISLGIGEPDFTAPPQVLQAMQRAADAGLSGYSPPAGLPALRQAIAHFYGERFGAAVDPGRVIVTSGASGALLLAAMALINPGDEILMPDPCYPANRNFILAAGGSAQINVTLPGARAGDFAQAAYSVGTSGFVFLAQVASKDLVTVTAWNRTAAPFTLNPGTVRVRVVKA